MKLSELLAGIEFTIKGDVNAEINDIVYDSRNASAGTVFFCIVGFQSDGHNFSQDAYDRGCRVFVAEHSLDLPEDATVAFTKNNRRALAAASANLFGNPAKRMLTIAITGTKGKTSTSHILKSIFEKAGHKVGLIGTTGIIYGDVTVKTKNSTPESYVIQKYYRAMADAGCDVSIIEATSQGFMLDRTYGIRFDIGIFTNLSPDHIGANEHKDFADYLECKKMIFGQSDTVYVNSDCEYFERIIEGADRSKIKTYGFGADADIHAEDMSFVTGDHRLITRFTCCDNEGKHPLDLCLPGEFSVYNALAAISVARGKGIPYSVIEEGLREASVRGRMEIVPGTVDYSVIIDFAHNEFSVQNLFDTLAKYSPKRIVAVFGCGGNRSKLRRYSMGEIIGRNAGLSIITSDNSRYEKVEDIIDDILIGMKKTDGKYIIIKDRREAIIYALDNALPGDVILLIGKGHEDYEEIEGVRYPFSEREIVLDYLRDAAR